MNDDNLDVEEAPFDPATMSTTSWGNIKVPLYRRPWLLLTVAVVLIVAVSVVTDLPRHITKSEDAASQNATISQINGDIKPCAFAVNEAFSFYNKDVSGKLTPGELAQTTGLLTGDQTVCSFAGQPVYDLTNNIEPALTGAGRNINLMLNVVVTWITDYALAAVEDIQYLLRHPGSSAKIQSLSNQEVHLQSERTLALHDLAAAVQILGLPLISLQLPTLPHLIGTAVPVVNS